MITVGTLRTEYAEFPLGIDVLPRLSWTLTSPERGVRQRAYQVLVASSAAALERDRGDVWDTGKFASDRSVHVAYEGKPLASATRYHWKVRVWDEHDTPSAWSEPAWWEMGLLGADVWVGSWIGGSPPTDAGSQPSPYLRRSFSPSGPVASARLYVTALGLYELQLNGQRVGQDLLVPGWTDLQPARRIPHLRRERVPP